MIAVVVRAVSFLLGLVLYSCVSGLGLLPRVFQSRRASCVVSSSRSCLARHAISVSTLVAVI